MSAKRIISLGRMSAVSRIVSMASYGRARPPGAPVSGRKRRLIRRLMNSRPIPAVRAGPPYLWNRFACRQNAIVTLAVAMLSGLLFVGKVPALDTMDLMELKGQARTDALKTFINKQATNAPISEILSLFDPELNLDADQLDALYLVAASRMTKREAYPPLSKQAESPIPGLAVPALRLLGLTSNADAFQILSRRIGDDSPEVAVAAMDGLGALGNARGIPLLEPCAAQMKPVFGDGQSWSSLKPGISAAFALAQLGKWDYAATGLDALGAVNQARLENTWSACRTTYGTPEQRKQAKDEVLRIKAWFRIAKPALENLCRKDPGQFAQAVGKCTQPYGMDMAYAVVEKLLNKDNAVAMLPLMNSASIEIKALYLDLGEPFFDDGTKTKIREMIREHAAQPRDVRARLFAIAYAHWLPAAEQETLLGDMLKDNTVWVRDQAVRKAQALDSAGLKARLKEMAEKDPDVLVRATAQTWRPSNVSP